MVRQFESGRLVAPIAEEHAAFRSMVRDIKADLDRLQSDPRSRVCGAVLLDRLCHMRERLKHHYEDEELAWRRRCERGMDATTQRWIRSVTDQHRRSEVELEQVIDDLGRSLSTDAFVPSPCNASVRALVTELVRLEWSDDRLFQRAIFEDLDGV